MTTGSTDDMDALILRDAAARQADGPNPHPPAIPVPADPHILDYARRRLREEAAMDLRTVAYGLIRSYADIPDPASAVASIRAVLQAHDEVRADKDRERARNASEIKATLDREPGRFPTLEGP